MLPGEPHDDESAFEGSSAARGGALTAEPVEDVLEREERWEELVARLIERAEAAPPGEHLHELVRAAKVFETRLGDPDKALLILQTAFRDDFAHDELSGELARLASALGRWPALLEEWNQLLPELPRERRIELLRAMARFQERHVGDEAAARRSKEAAAALEPEPDVTTPAPEARGVADGVPTPAPAAEARPPAEPPLATIEAVQRALDERRFGEARARGQAALERPDAVGFERADLAYWTARACLAEGDVEAAKRLLLRGLEAVPDHRDCRAAMVEACERSGDEAAADHHRQALLGLLPSDEERFDVLVRAARRQRDDKHDTAAAVRLYEQALGLDPNHDTLHGTLHDVLDLHTAAKDWKAAVQVLERLTGLESGRARARYLVATANILNYNLHALDQAIELYNQALDEDPDDLKTFERIERIVTSKRAWRDEARNFRRMIKRLGPTPGPEKRAVALMLWKGLGETCRSRLKDLPAAAAAFEVCATLDPADVGSHEILAEIFERQGAAELPRAVEKRTLLAARTASPEDLVRQLKALLRLYGEARQSERAFCACAALVAMGAAGPREIEWYQQMAARPLRPPRAALGEEMWQRAVYHPSEDRRVSHLFALVSSSVALLRAKEPRAWGLDERWRIPTTGDAPLARLLVYASELLGMGVPPLFVLPDRPGLLDMANVLDQGRAVATLVGGADLTRPRTEREIAFLVGRALALLRFDHLVLWPQVVASPPELRVVALAVIKMFQPDLPVGSAEQSAVKQYMALLQRTLPPHVLEPLMALLPTLGENPQAVDVAGWAGGALRTANRAGLLVCGDVVVAARAAVELAAGQGLAPDDVVGDLVRWSVSAEHLGLRELLGLDGG